MDFVGDSVEVTSKGDTMKPRILFVAAAVLVIFLAEPRLASAQQTGYMGIGGHSDNPNGPTVSPYMNLL